MPALGGASSTSCHSSVEKSDFVVIACLPSLSSRRSGRRTHRSDWLVAVVASVHNPSRYWRKNQWDSGVLPLGTGRLASRPLHALHVEPNGQEVLHVEGVHCQCGTNEIFVLFDAKALVLLAELLALRQ